MLPWIEVTEEVKPPIDKVLLVKWTEKYITHEHHGFACCTIDNCDFIEIHGISGYDFEPDFSPEDITHFIVVEE